MKEAGRKLDALVAEKVMGHRLTLDRRWANDQPIPYYSTNIAAAWQVVEMLYKHGFGVGVVTQHGWDTACECIVFKTSIVDDDTIHASADTAPHAICLAALAALGVEVTK